ncbi:MAG: hypothetical protein KJO07_25470, partial [Deltaproteobacteria bacterium]|nr:hypothetical protein [Deltaproteobacteria bacterium]
MTRAFAIAVALLAGCNGQQMPVMDCDDSCDRDGPLALTDTWVPEGGFVRAEVTGDFELEVSPSAGATIEPRAGGRYIVRFAVPGFYRLAAGDGRIGVRVSNRGPAVVLDEIGQGGFASTGRQTLRGTVSDSLGGATLVLEGERVALGSSGEFEAEVDAGFGVYIADFEIIDQVGNRFAEPHSFIAADDYGIREQPIALGFSPDGAALLAQEIADGLPEVLAELATAEPVYESFLADVYIDSYEFPEVELTLEPTDDGLRVILQAQGVVTARGRIDAAIDSTFVARVPGLSLSALLATNPSSGAVEVTLSALSVDSGNPDIEVFGVIPDAVFAWMVGNVDDRVEAAVEEGLPRFLSELFSSAADDFEVAVPNSDRKLLGALAVRELDIDADGVELVLGAVVAPPADVDLGIGPPRASGPRATLPAGGDSALISNDVLNQYLYALWLAGGLDRELDESNLPDEIMQVPALAQLDPIVDIAVVPRLPPVVTSGEQGLVVSAGDVGVTLSVSTEFF